jgi:uncharacterized protein (TIGR02611 family)
MSAGVEGSKRLETRPRSRPTSPPSPSVDPPAPKPVAEPSEPHDHHLLIDAHEDRWRWRRKIRENPRKLFFYRICVALLGVLLVMLGALTGPLPGPGGIPLVLLGIAVWSSEFEWAQRLMYWFKAQLKRYRNWPRRQQVLFWAIFTLACGTLLYTFLVVVGVPFWVPDFARDLLERLPGV